jgi:hypothetical protein
MLKDANIIFFIFQRGSCFFFVLILFPLFLIFLIIKLDSFLEIEHQSNVINFFLDQ